MNARPAGWSGGTRLRAGERIYSRTSGKHLFTLAVFYVPASIQQGAGDSGDREGGTEGRKEEMDL